jgi:hypothetical protein
MQFKKRFVVFFCLLLFAILSDYSQTKENLPEFTPSILVTEVIK